MDLRHPFRFLSSALAGDILVTLARADKAFTGREIERAVGHGSRGAYVRALRLLTEEGVVRSERAGRATLYRLNSEHLAAGAIADLATSRDRLLERLREQIGAWEIQPRAAILFGSAARGEAGSESDLDILVIRAESIEPDDGDWRSQVMSLADAATAWTGNDARILEYGEDDLPSGPGEEPVIDTAFDEGIELAGASIRSLRRRIAAGVN